MQTLLMIDDIDRSILNLLQQDSKMAIKEIGSKINLSSTPVFERIKRLKNDGFIKAYSINVDPDKVGLSLMVFCTISLNQHQSEALILFEKEILQFTEIHACYHIAGMFDYLVHVYVKDMKEYQKFVSTKLASMENIRKVQSSFVMTEVKAAGVLSIM